jgi:hypothetical protein
MISFCLMLLLKFRNAFLQTLFYKHTCKRKRKRTGKKKLGCYSRIMCITVRRFFFIFISYIVIGVFIRPKRFRSDTKTHTHTHSHPIRSIIHQVRLDYYHHHSIVHHHHLHQYHHNLRTYHRHLIHYD